MNRKNALGTLLALGLLTTLSAQAEVVFAQANLLLNKNQLSAVNYRGKGLSLPVGTKVEVLERDDDEVRCKVLGSGAEFRFVSHKSLGKDASEMFPFFFSATDPAARIAALSPEEQKQVKAGTLAKGMSRDAVLLTVGPPPPHRTLSLESTTWTYWSSKFSTFQVVFDGEGKVVSHGDEPAPAPPAPAPKGFHYATANFHFQDDTVSWVNYLKGPILAFNTQVEVLDKGGSKVKFKVVETGKELVFENDSRSGADTWALFQASFAPEDQAARLATLSPEDRKKVSASEVVPGMSRTAVRMAWGPPPPHETPSFDSTVWTYWRSKTAKVRVTFDKDDKVASIE
ncbi:outer membrane protein assembly factor BamE [Pyxidicoccus xibeiensis]|uniref:outer membrane protein assembly factor BamE n=1 Tax=Pyxidicoccus xibeiensis TaxID=2906759 RepID=UPI0020A6DF41|nr:outer membrane protein assembly factor BamE [Pyxidicoccus xibeiensis]MCP3139416.1 outer membrane protein assembly factor BamE [Pyxidicoccus xibeiensis]